MKFFHLKTCADLKKAFLFLLLPGLLLVSCKKSSNAPQVAYTPQENLTGVPSLSGTLDKSKFTMSSIIQVDLNRDVARVPLFKGTYNGATVWYVRTDVSDSVIARKLGLNFAPRLINADTGCTSCIQAVASADPIPGNLSVAFVGTVDFSPMRKLVAGPTGFPAAVAIPGSVGSAQYSDLIRVQGSNVVYNAPIVATGDGPFDVSESHTNTLDRVVAIDPINRTVDLQFIRAFSGGKDIFYFSFSATAEESATIERGTYVPAMAGLPYPNEDEKGSRSDIFAFADGKLGLNNEDVQGLNHVILDNAPGNFSLTNPNLFETLRTLGDARNVLANFPTLTDKHERELYTPLWDLNVAVWSDDVIKKGMNFAQKDGNTILQLSKGNYITSPGGTPLSSANIIVNCPALGFATTAPTVAQAPKP